MKPKKKPLEVRRHIDLLSSEGPRTEMKCRGHWVLCKNYAEAREYAAKHDYPGITIKIKTKPV